MSKISLPSSVEINEYHPQDCRNHGQLPVPANIIFGIRCRTSGITLLFPVLNKTQDTLLPIIQEYIQEGPLIDDNFSTYVRRRGVSHLDLLGYNHCSINHSLAFAYTDFCTYK